MSAAGVLTLVGALSLGAGFGRGGSRTSEVTSSNLTHGGGELSPQAYNRGEPVAKITARVLDD